MRSMQADWKVVFIIAAAFVVAEQSVAAALPSVYRATATVYANVTDPEEIAFGTDGALYVGRDPSGSGGGYADTVRIHRVGPGGTPVEEFGRTAIPDPDAVVVDRTGTISGLVGAVLVGGLDDPGASTGHIKAIRPDGLVFDLFTALNPFRNINAFAFNRSGGLLALDGEGWWGEVTTSEIIPLGQVAPGATGISVDLSNRVWVSTSAGPELSVFSATGTFLYDASVGAMAGSALASSSSEFWGTNIYAIGTNGSLLSLDVFGNVRVRGSGFQNTAYMTFGDDGSLYLSEFANDRIVKITPDGGPTLSVRVSAVELCWNSLPHLNYQVQYRSDLTTNAWVNLGPQVPGTGDILCTTDGVYPAEKRFYRVQELP